MVILKNPCNCSGIDLTKCSDSLIMVRFGKSGGWMVQAGPVNYRKEGHEVMHKPKVSSPLPCLQNTS